MALSTVLPSDIDYWESYYGITTPWTQELLDGQALGSTGDGENTLDTETVLGVAPGLLGVILYSNGNSTVDYAQALSENRVASISSSYGYGESSTEVQQMQQAAAQGITVCVATGDSGSWAVGSSVQPVDDPNVVGVGGTSVWANPTNPLTYNWEEGWSGSGGGVTNGALPPYQDKLDFAAFDGSNSGRNLPDVAMPADPYNAYSCYLNGNWGGIGGTSWAAPGFNAVMADVASVNGSRSGCINTVLYEAIATGPEYASSFNDIEAGSNGGYTAVAGYDLVTGWGSPKFGGLAAAIKAGYAGAAPWAPSLTATPGNTEVTLTWSTSSSVTSFNIYRGTSPGGEGSTPIATPTGTTYTDSGLTNGTTYYYTITAVGPTGVSPVSNEASATPNVPGAYNVIGIDTEGTPSQNGGLDTGWFAYDANLLGSSTTWNGAAFNFGPANAPDCWSQTNALVSGSGTLFMLAVGVDGAQQNQPFTVTYTDGTTSTFVQSLSDWCNPQSYSGESTVVSMASRLDYVGDIVGPGPNVYGYSFPLVSGKTIQSVALPNDRDVVALAFATGVTTPSAPTGLTAAAGNARVTLSWTPSNGGATSYNVFRGTGPGGEGSTPIGSSTTTGYTDNTATNGTTYYYTVDAVDSAGTSGQSNEASATPNVPGAYNVHGIDTPGTPTSDGGIDTVGFAMDSTQLGASYTWDGSTFTFGSPNTADCWSSTTALVSGSGSLQMLAIGVEGSQQDQIFRVTYTDGSTQTFTQSLSDWFNPQSFPGESIAFTMNDRIDSAGDVVGGNPNVYGYSFPLAAGKELQSVTLPSNRYVVVLALATSVPAPELASITAEPKALMGDETGTVTITLTEPAPDGGIIVPLMSEDRAAAKVSPTSVVIPAGSTSGTAVVKGYPVTANTLVTLYANYVHSHTCHVTVLAPIVEKVEVLPSKVVGGAGIQTGTVTLTSPAAAVTSIGISSDSANAIVPSYVLVQPGHTTATFQCKTKMVADEQTATITATGASNSAAYTITIKPQSTVSGD